VDTVCGNCGSPNEPGARFCSFCGTYLGWEEQSTPSTESTDATPARMTEQPHEPPPRSQAPAFHATIDDLEVTVPVDGTPVRVPVEIANTSTIVDGYVVEAVDAPPWLEATSAQVELLPGTQEEVRTQLWVTSRALVPAQTVPVTLRVRNTTGSLSVQDTTVQITVPALAVPVELHAEPTLVRVNDLDAGACTIVVDNSHSNVWVQVRMSANDPEAVVGVTWSQPHVRVAPGGEARIEARLVAPPPDPGSEVSRTITVAAEGDGWTAMTTVTLVQVASQAPMELLSLRLEPTTLRLGGGRRGRLRVTLDNRRGATPVDLRLSGADTESRLGFAFRPAMLRVAPGQQASAQVTVTAPRTPPGNEVTRAVTIVASDGRNDVRADGTVIQLSTSHRGLARVVLTVLGALLIVLGALMPFFATGELRAIDLSVVRIADLLAGQGLAEALDTEQVPGDLEQVVSVGLGLMVLAGLVLFGLTGGTGRLTRYSSVLAAGVVVATVLVWVLLGAASGPGMGAGAVVVGCVLGYAGGAFARR
jgi:hypothetical protein